MAVDQSTTTPLGHDAATSVQGEFQAMESDPFPEHREQDCTQPPFHTSHELHTYVQQQYAVLPDVTLECGRTLHRVPIAYKTWGTLNANKNNCFVVCHALTGSADVADWWEPLVGPDRAFDTERFFVVCMNMLASPYGSCSPLTIDPDTDQAYGGDFPVVTIRDTVRAHRRVLSTLGVQSVVCVAGGSLGGCQTLEWAILFPNLVRSLIPIATAGRLSAWGIGLGELQKQSIRMDSSWRKGMYALDEAPVQGLAMARMSAMMTYRRDVSFAQRFGRKLQPSSAQSTKYQQNPYYSIQSYLQYQGRKFVKRFDANCYMRITDALEGHDVSRERGEYTSVLGGVRQPSLVIGVDSDTLFPLSEQKELAECMPCSRLAVVSSPDGHDGFLLESDEINRIVRQWLLPQLAELQC